MWHQGRRRVSKLASSPTEMRAAAEFQEFVRQINGSEADEGKDPRTHEL